MPRDQVQVGYCGIPKFTSVTLFTNKESHFLFHVKRKGGCPIFHSIPQYMDVGDGTSSWLDDGHTMVRMMGRNRSR